MPAMNCPLLIIGLMLGVAASSKAAVYRVNTNGQVLRWITDSPVSGLHTNVVNPQTRAVRIFLSEKTYSQENREAELNAIRASFDQWQAVPGQQLRFEHAGPAISASDVDLRDNTNLVFWTVDSVWINGGLDNISGSLGLTYTRETKDHQLLESDIVLNGREFEWFTDVNQTNTTARFVESVAAHEIGHLLGLLHSPIGGATMFPRGVAGINPQAGLSSDEIGAMRVLYPDNWARQNLGALRGTITCQEIPVWGAVITAEDESGNLVGGVISQADGSYDLSAIPPGIYQVRVVPLDPANAFHFLCRGQDIAYYPTFSPATDFLPTSNAQLTVTAGTPVVRHFEVAKGEPVFRANRILRPVAQPSNWVAVNAPCRVMQGSSDILVGVFGENLPTKNASLVVSGTGISIGPARFYPAAVQGLNLIAASIRVESNAPPGLRSFQVQQGTNLAWANGCLEIAPLIADDNFDGLDDRFQRANFPLFTAPSAAPAADPDGDGLNNQQEYLAKTDPTDSDSVLRITRIRLANAQILLSWQGRAGVSYQVMGGSAPVRTALAAESPILTGADTEMQWTAPIRAEIRYYWIELN